MPGIRFYCGVNERGWNHHQVRPGKYACIAPVYGASVETKRENVVRVPSETIVLQDSGAFSDGPGQRLGFEAALERQLAHSAQYGYAVSHRASYDLLIDEMWQDGKRIKRRWTKEDANEAVAETIAAADYLRSHYDKPRVLSVQGVTPDQYLRCAQEIIPMLDDGDILGLGGWCISGKIPGQMLPVFDKTMARLIPYVAIEGVKHVHIWGVVDSIFLGRLLWLCDQHGVFLSTDSAGPQVRPARSGIWGYRGWRNYNYQRADPSIRGLHRILHVAATRCFLQNGLKQTAYYRQPEIEAKQMEIWPCMW